MSFPTSLSIADWTTLEKFITGGGPATRDIAEAVWDAEGVGLNYIFPAATPAPNPTPKKAAPMSKAEAIDICKQMQSSGKTALPINWAAFVQLLIQLLFGGLIPATP